MDFTRVLYYDSFWLWTVRILKVFAFVAQALPSVTAAAATGEVK